MAAPPAARYRVPAPPPPQAADDDLGDVLARDMPWEAYHTARLISERDVQVKSVRGWCVCVVLCAGVLCAGVLCGWVVCWCGWRVRLH